MELKIRVCGGRGGDGCVSFLHLRRRPLGGPDGGNGGDGGSVLIVGDRNLNSLMHINPAHLYKAEDGISGSSNGKKGRNGGDLLIKVPLDTEVYADKKLITKICNRSDMILVAKGGRGGRGNQSLKTAKERLPTRAENGRLGERRLIALKFHIMIDVAIIGKTNCGKSSFLEKLTGASPKVSARPFTTKMINLGVIQSEHCELRIGELPSKDLNHYIEHLKDSKMIVILIDVSDRPEKQFQEFARFLEKNGLSQTERIVIFNKIDTASEPYPRIANEECYYVSALYDSGLAEIKARIIGLKDAP